MLANQTMSIPNVPVADLAITKSHTGNFAVGTNGTYILSVTNNGPSSTSGTVTVTDTLPAGLTYVSGTGTGWTCGAIGQAVTCTYSGSLASGASAPAITLTVSVGNAAYPSVTNTATVTDTSGTFDNVSGNNTSSDVTTVIGPDLSTSAKTVVDLDGGDTLPGDTLQYTITVRETNGVAATGVSVSDPIDANLTNVIPVSCGGGGTCSYLAPNLSCSGITVPAGGSVTIVYTADISGSAAPGTTINNTATITPAAGTGGTAVAPVVTVPGYPSGSGNKQLYLYNAASTPPRKLSRTPMTITAGSYVTIAKNSTTVTWTLDPVLASAVTINSGNIPVELMLATNSARTYTIPITLRCGASTVASQTTQTAALTGTVTRFTFTLPLASAYTCPAGSAFSLDITNTMTGGIGARDVRVYPAPSAGNYSYVNLSSQNVIQVNSIGFYEDTAYPGGNLLPTVAAGSTVRIRSVVSDPFGSYDIVTPPTITIKNPSGTTLVNAAPMTLVATGTETPSLTKTYEYRYTVPSSPSGNWSVSVTASEGTEATPVTNTAYATMPVVVPLANVSILKSANKSSTISGDIITYSILLTNNGAGPATSVSIDDALSLYIQWGLNSYPGGAFDIVQGATPSGLTLGTPVYYSGASVYVPVSGSGGAPAGYDGNVTRFVLPLTGTMNPNGASCTIYYQVRVK